MLHNFDTIASMCAAWAHSGGDGCHRLTAGVRPRPHKSPVATRKVSGHGREAEASASLVERRICNFQEVWDAAGGSEGTAQRRLIRDHLSGLREAQSGPSAAGTAIAIRIGTSHFCPGRVVGCFSRRHSVRQTSGILSERSGLRSRAADRLPTGAACAVGVSS
jgi:hypothetical protein